MMTSKEMGIKLFNVARASLLELLEDYADYLRSRGFEQWDAQSEKVSFMRQLAAQHDDSRYFLELAESRSDEVVANMAIVLIYQAEYLLSKFIDKEIEKFAAEGGFREQMTRIRLSVREK